MKRIFNWQVNLSITLIALSAALYYLHYFAFHDSHHIFIYLIGDIAFVPIEVLLVTVIIHRVLSVREKRAMLEKLNMVIGAFFSETGSKLLGDFTEFDANIDDVREKLAVDNSWSSERFDEIRKLLKNEEYFIDIRKGNLQGLRDFLTTQKTFLLSLLANPNLLEHDSFTDLLWAVFHLMEELIHREDVTTLPDSDLDHIKGGYPSSICGSGLRVA